MQSSHLCLTILGNFVLKDACLSIERKFYAKFLLIKLFMPHKNNIGMVDYKIELSNWKQNSRTTI